MAALQLQARPLTREAFAPFGEVIETDGARHFAINAGTIERFHDLARVEVGDGGRTLVSLARANQVTTLPHAFRLVERHPLGSQAFFPLFTTPMVVVVAPAGEEVRAEDLRAFVSNGGQGINYRPGVWHLPLIALEEAQQFLIVDRGGPGANCDERQLEREVLLSL